MARKKEENPMFTKKGAWMWLACAPVAFLVSGHYEMKKSMRKADAKRHKKAVKHWDNFWS